MDWKERTYCGDIRPSHRGKEVLLLGWVDAVRDHGNLVFIHLRDVRGIVQVVFDPALGKDTYSIAASLREEYVVQVRGRVAGREKGTENPSLDTGEVEVIAAGLKVISPAPALPFKISEKAMFLGEETTSSPLRVDEELRLQYRFLDLRRPSMQNLLIKRHEIIKCIRQCLDERGFVEVETPTLTRSTPEGARDYLVPSRIHRGRFYALPQSPQLFKQLLMLSGMDRYFQIARCYRDEDLRPNRQPEFTQMDLEASFIDEEFIYETTEELAARVFAVGGIELPRPFPRMTYEEAMNRYGTDRPDVRFDMAFEHLSRILTETRYSIFRRVLEKGGVVKGFCIKARAGDLSKNVLQNEYALKIAPSLGAGGMTWMKAVDGAFESNIVQFFGPSELESMRDRFRVEDGDVLIIVADPSLDLVNKVLCGLRLHLAERLGLIPGDRYCPLWVTDFPLFEVKDGRLGSQHHPFTMPDRTDFDPLDKLQCLKLKSRAYDLVVNGEELGGGSIRIHRMDIQKKIFMALDLTEKELESKFGFFLRALEYGAPPHGGLALGMDRVIAMVLKTPSIREVIAFPKSRSAFCPLTGAPSEVEDSQLEDIGFSGPQPPETREQAGRSKGLQGPPLVPAGAERVSPEEVLHLAELARLRLSDQEIGSYRKDLNAILGYVETLNELETEAVPPMAHVMELRNVSRKDAADDSGIADLILSNAPSSEKGFIKVPKILEG